MSLGIGLAQTSCEGPAGLAPSRTKPIGQPGQRALQRSGIESDLIEPERLAP
jgi:hypothetical protein